MADSPTSNPGPPPSPPPSGPAKPGLSIFFPAYNDGGTIASMVALSHSVCRELGIDHEVIVVEDGSQDSTPQVLRELERIYPTFRVVWHEKNRGYGGALRSGFAACRKELVFYTDGDAQYDVREVPALLGALADSIDIVNGYKITRADPFHRRLIGRTYHWIVKVLFGLTLRDVDCDFRLIRRRVFEKVTLTESSGVICLEMMKKFQNAGFRIAEVPVHHYHRAYGKSQFFRFRRIARVAYDVARLWWGLVVRREH